MKLSCLKCEVDSSFILPSWLAQASLPVP